MNEHPRPLSANARAAYLETILLACVGAQDDLLIRLAARARLRGAVGLAGPDVVEEDLSDRPAGTAHPPNKRGQVLELVRS